MPITYGMVGGRDHGCDHQPLTTPQVTERETFMRMRKYEVVSIDELLGIEEEREAKKRRRAAYMLAKKCRA